MSRKCKHKSLAQKFMRTDKYGEPLLVEYTYCSECGEIFKGGVTFVEPVEAPSPKPGPVKKIVEVEKTPKQIDKPKVEKAKPKPTKKTVKKKSTKKKKTSKTKEVSVSKKKDKKVINPKPPRGDSELRKHSRKPEAAQAPEGASLGDILRAKYGVKGSGAKKDRNQEVSRKGRYKSIEDPYDDSFEDDGDVDVFLK